MPRRGRRQGVCEPRGGGCGSGGGTAACREVGGRKWKPGKERARERERERAAAPRRAWEPTVVATRGGTARSVLGRGSIPPRRGSLAPSAAGLARPFAGPGKPAVLTAGGRAGGCRGPGGAPAWRGFHVALTDPSHFRLGPVKCRAQNTTLAPARRGSVHSPQKARRLCGRPSWGRAGFATSLCSHPLPQTLAGTARCRSLEAVLISEASVLVHPCPDP